MYDADDIRNMAMVHEPQHAECVLRKTLEVLSEKLLEDGTEAGEFRVNGISRRPFSTVSFIECTAGTAKGSRFVIKTVAHHEINRSITEKENQALVEYNILKDLFPKFSKVSGCSVPKPILVLPDLETYVMYHVEGNLLSDELKSARYFAPRKSFSALRKHYYHCGLWLRKFHEFTGITKSSVESFCWILNQMNQRLDLIEELQDERCPRQLRGIVHDTIDKQLSALRGEEILVSGRHGDFGGWNIIAGKDGITVIDFLGTQIDPIAIDLTKMLMNFEDEKRYLAYSAKRIDILKDEFLEGYGKLPEVQVPVLIICEMVYRIYSLYGSLMNPEKRLHRRIERGLSMKSNISWLMQREKTPSLWPIKRIG